LPELNPEPAVTTVAVTGPVTLAQVAHWHGALSDGFSRGQGLMLDLAGSGPWDLAGVQLLLAAIASGQRAGVPTVLANVPNVLMAVAERAALRDQLVAIALK
jgi:STAS domain